MIATLAAFAMLVGRSGTKKKQYFRMKGRPGRILKYVLSQETSDSPND
jgi:hypothetical protein